MWPATLPTSSAIMPSTFSVKSPQISRSFSYSPRTRRMGLLLLLLETNTFLPTCLIGGHRILIHTISPTNHSGWQIRHSSRHARLRSEWITFDLISCCVCTPWIWLCATFCCVSLTKENLITHLSFIIPITVFFGVSIDWLERIVFTKRPAAGRLRCAILH